MTATGGRAAGADKAPLLMAGLIVFNLWHLLGGPVAAFWGIALSATGFVWLARSAIPASIARICAALVLIGLVVWPFGGAGLHSITRGVYIGAMIASVMASVSLLARAAQRSPGLQTVTGYLSVLTYRRRYLMLAAASQVFPCLLGFAGVHMLFGVASRGAHAGETERLALFTAITRSFSAATLWSPTFGNMVILLALYPQLRWSQVLPIGLSFAAATIVLSLFVDRRVFLRHHDQADEPPPPGVVRASVRVLGSMLAFFAVVVAVSLRLEIPVSGAIAMLAPAVALGLHGYFNVFESGDRTAAGAWRRFATDAAALRGFAPEVLLFMAAGCGGSVIADSVPPAWIAYAVGLLAGHAALAILALMLCIILLSCVGLHPVLTVVLLASTFTPQALGLPVLPHFCALLTGWGIASVVAPFSMLNMTAARYSGLAPYQISMRQNWQFGVVAVVVATLGLSLLA
ncbi:hypothetical protein FOZ76_15800 [Verticiella sediminum]|uniref:Uncharacterized protein n=1 Tax=Verticiella sediminum TaxID=1247510 RepID=A0A556AIZ6_9BURK|nr:hypothetical protein [Verticiella sediminum]TSH92857.1 hypothetical protein FOZ76_15800 [Verticiella sediminum]